MKKKVLFAALALLASLTQDVLADPLFSMVVSTGQTIYFGSVTYNPTGNKICVVPPGATYGYVDSYEGYAKPVGDLVIPSTVTYNGETFTVTKVYNKAFYHCDSLTSVVLPSTITEIGTNAFNGCVRLRSVNIPDLVTTINSSAFSGCWVLDPVTVPSTVTTIGGNAFSEVRMINYSGTATSYNNWGAVCRNGYIEDSLYYTSNAKDSLMCSHPDIITAIIPGTVSYIGWHAFMGREQLTWADGYVRRTAPLRSLTVPNSVEEIAGSDAFNECQNLTYLNWDVDSLNFSFGYNNYPSLTTIVIGNNARYIPNDFCYQNYNPQGNPLTSLTIGDNVRYIGNNAFHYCNSINTPIHIQQGSIGSGAFSYCTSLPAVTFGDGVTSIGGGAFDCDSNLTAISIPASVTYIGYGAFSNCAGLTTVFFDGSTDDNETSIFYGDTNITTVTFGDNVTRIPQSLFSDCRSLENVSFGNSITTIGTYAFSGCANLKDFTLPSSLTTIEESAFLGCDRLRNIDIPASVSTIGNSAFGWDNHINYETGETDEINVFFHMLGSNPPELGIEALFVGNNSGVNVAVTVPCGALENYQADASWSGLITTAGGDNVDWFVGENCNDYYVFARPAYCSFAFEYGSDEGRISGTGSYNNGHVATLHAEAPQGYHFARWNDGNTDNPRQITVSSDTILIATFEEGTEGIDNVDGNAANVTAADGRIVVTDANGHTVTLYDAAGRQLAVRRNEGSPVHFDVPASGTYLVKVGSAPARRIVVVR